MIDMLSLIRVYFFLSRFPEVEEIQHKPVKCSKCKTDKNLCYGINWPAPAPEGYDKLVFVVSAKCPCKGARDEQAELMYYTDDPDIGIYASDADIRKMNIFAQSMRESEEKLANYGR